MKRNVIDRDNSACTIVEVKSEQVYLIQKDKPPRRE
jgi:hypothetical protein